MIGTALTHYRITAKLGAGGMGEVYRATDTKLGREVAIKVLPTSISQHPGSLVRFEREARALAALNHPNIAAIHGFEADGGTHFLVLELVEGETLAERLRRGALAVKESMSVARQIAEAIQEAHERGIIHRDLKPGNVKIAPSGRVKVLDFGLAKIEESIRTTTEPEQEMLDRDAPTVPMDRTVAGAVMGTPAYMSPEQARGEEVDKRTDIWAFGCCVYECLTGQRPFKGATASDLIAEVLKSEPDWTRLPTETPREVLTLVRRCLEKEPARRLSSMGDIAITLDESTRGIAGLPQTPTSSSSDQPASLEKRSAKRFWLGAVGLLLLGIGARSLFWKHPEADRKSGVPSTLVSSTAVLSASSSGDQKSIAVLPFVSMSADKSDEYLSDGMTEELLNVLAQVPGLRVPGRSSSFAFKGKMEENIFRKVGEQLHVTTVLEGSVRKAGDKLRITAQLINVADGFHLWSTNYDREMKDILAVQTEVAQQVAQVLQVKLGVEATRALAKTQNPEAHRLYLLGRYHFGKVTEAGYTNAMQYFTQALQLDPSYALAYCGLADLYGWMGGPLMSGKEAWAKEKELAQKALALDPNLADAHLSLGMALVAAFNSNGGKQEMNRAIELNPRLALAYDQLAWLQSMFGRFEEAIRNKQKAIELDPLSLMFNCGLGAQLTAAGRYDESVLQLRKTLELDPNYVEAHFHLGLCSLWKGDRAGAIGEFEKAIALDPQPWFGGHQAYAYARLGERAKAEQIVRYWDQRAKYRYVSPVPRMMLNLGLSEKDKALDWLEKCYEEQDGICWLLKVYPMFDPLRTEPRFQALLKKVFPEP